jgi:hypothetical protein
MLTGSANPRIDQGIIDGSLPLATLDTELAAAARRERLQLIGD